MSIAKQAAPHLGLNSFLDKVIVLLMVAIMLAIVWPVGMVLWGQSRPAQKMVCALDKGTKL